jgi:hypothetical protein
MKAAWGSVLAAGAASVCCVGPVLAVTVGATALTAVSIRFEPFRPVFLSVATILLGFGFYNAYRPTADPCSPDSTCAADSRRRARFTLWFAAALVVLFAAVPYYVEYLF